MLDGFSRGFLKYLLFCALVRSTFLAPNAGDVGNVHQIAFGISFRRASWLMIRLAELLGKIVLRLRLSSENDGL